METIKKTILPSRQTAREKIQNSHDAYREATRQAKARERQEEEARRAHQEAEDVAANTPGSQHQLFVDKDEDESVKEWMDKREEYDDEEKQSEFINRFGFVPFLIEETSFPGSKFFDSAHFGGKAIIEYNMQHTFFQHLYGLLESLDDPEADGYDPVQTAEQMKVAIDLMITAYARAEANFADGTLLKAEDFIDDIRNYWGQHLQSYINHLNAEDN